METTTAAVTRDEMVIIQTDSAPKRVIFYLALAVNKLGQSNGPHLRITSFCLYVEQIYSTSKMLSKL